MQNNRNLSTKAMILDICSMPGMAKRLKKINRDYAPLVEFLTAKDYYYDEDIKLPTIKVIQEQTGIDYSRVRKMISMLYHDLVSLERKDEIPIIIERLEIWLYVRGYEASTWFQIEGMTVIPRKGESFSLPYCREYVGENSFYVDDVEHKFDDSVHIVSVFLKGGSYNSYWDLRKDRALSLHELPIKDFYFTNDWVLQKKLLDNPNSRW